VEGCGDDLELELSGNEAVLRLSVTGTWRPIAIAVDRMSCICQPVKLDRPM
jgi:hypothetical protein